MWAKKDGKESLNASTENDITKTVDGQLAKSNIRNVNYNPNKINDLRLPQVYQAR